MSRRLLLAILLALPIAFVASSGRGDEPAKPVVAKGEKKEGAKKAPPADKFMRVRRNGAGIPVAMETAITSYISADGKRPEVLIDLIGAVHVGDRGYYDELNKMFEAYDVLLFELVAPEGTKLTKDSRKGGGAHPIGMLQDGMKSMLGLEHQLDCIDYTKQNFVHADMSPDEFNKKMTERGESFMQMFLRMMGQGMAQQNGKGGSSDAAILLALFSRDRTLKLKIAMAEQLEVAGGQLDAIDGPDGSTIITERNKKCFEVLAKQLEAGKKKIGVFYGAGHLPDMQERLEKEFGMKRSGEKWLAAWSLEKAAAAPKKEDKPKEAAQEEKKK